MHYDRDNVTVTDHWLEVWGRRYPLPELTHLREVRGQYSHLTINAALVAAALALARLWDRLGAEGWIGALVVLAIPVLLAVLGIRLRRRNHLMLAEYRGLTVVLLSDDDRERFNQIVRAIRRAFEVQHR